MQLRRWLRHWFTTPQAVRRAFPESALTRIHAAIAATEATHSGEIRFAIEATLPWSYLRRGAPVRQRAVMIFSKLRVWDTEYNNGVLLYVELADHGVEIVADRGIARRVAAAEWQAICESLREHFRRGAFEEGVTQAIVRIGAQLTGHFPLEPGAQNPNELSDRPVIL
jgi:uncharacterized membrane protein